MNEYQQQAQEFLKKTGAKIEVRYIRTGLYWPRDKDSRDVYEFRITRGTREYTSEYGNSIAESTKRIAALLPKNEEWCADRILKGESADSLMNTSFGPIRYKNNLKKWTAAASEWHEATPDTAITPYDILACMTKSEPADNVDDFAAEYGYEKPSEAIRTYEAVKKEWAGMVRLFTDAELLDMQEIA